MEALRASIDARGSKAASLKERKEPKRAASRRPHASPLDDEMHEFDSKDLKRLFGIPASQIRALIRAGHIHPLKKAGRLSYSFQDLIVLRTAGSLRAAKIPAQTINRTLRADPRLAAGRAAAERAVDLRHRRPHRGARRPGAARIGHGSIHPGARGQSTQGGDTSGHRQAPQRARCRAQTSRWRHPAHGVAREESLREGTRARGHRSCRRAQPRTRPVLRGTRSIWKRG